MLAPGEDRCGGLPGAQALPARNASIRSPSSAIRRAGHSTDPPSSPSLDRVAGLRRGVGPDVDIMLDFGGGLTTDQTLNVCRRLEEFDILFVEEPADPFTLVR